MTGCPGCGRPPALARPHCAYCGAPLGERAPTASPAPTTPEGDPGGATHGPGTRVLLILDLAQVAVETLCRATGLPPYDAALLARRGGLHLWRALDAGAAAAAAARIADEGVVVFAVPEAEARLPPLPAVAGELRGERLALRVGRELVAVAASELLLVVSGEITREPATRYDRRRIDTARPDAGWLVHLHRVPQPRALEIDAGNFSPGFAVTGSARLELEHWLATAAAGVPRDDGFRRLAAALSPAEALASGPLSAVSALRSRSEPGARGRGMAAETPTLLDNVAQFRFYSGWRAAVERRRTRSLPAAPAC